MLDQIEPDKIVKKEKPIKNSNSVIEIEQEVKGITQTMQKPANLFFPWLSTLSSLLFIGFLVLTKNSERIEFYSIPNFLLTQQTIVSLLVLLGLIYIFDIRYFLKKKSQYQHRIINLQQQLDNVWESKKKQQQRANLYSGHADKLKYFISEKLLETIEYDEKYLHFKGIAAEVRHNGVISYDKVITALNKAIDQHHLLANHEKNTDLKDTSNRQSLNSLSSYQTAIDAIRYLWDLLDLSTAENMGLHISNHLIECEEHYYQLNLDSNERFDITQSIPILPSFRPEIASLMTFAILFDEPEINNTISLAIIDDSILKENFKYENEQFSIELAPTPSLLGNPNHIILLLENLIKNAQFFSQKNRTKQKTDRIQMRLVPGEGYAEFCIYNRGPQIKLENFSQIFKLGYSTRKNQQHHGKGLGLFFASEIVKGYNGQIQATNINNIETHYTIQLNLDDGTSIIKSFSSQWIEGRMKVVADGDSTWQNELNITSKTDILSIEISTNDDNETLISETILKKTDFVWIDSSSELLPRWIIQLKYVKRLYKLNFKPLDISGVTFNIKIPTADSRLNEQQLDFEDDNIPKSPQNVGFQSV